MSPEKAVRVLVDVVETAGAHHCSIELHGEFDDAELVLEAMRVVLNDLRERDGDTEDQIGGDDFDDEEEDWEDTP